jgi:hypothetical protein
MSNHHPIPQSIINRHNTHITYHLTGTTRRIPKVSIRHSDPYESLAVVEARRAHLQKAAETRIRGKASRRSQEAALDQYDAAAAAAGVQLWNDPNTFTFPSNSGDDSMNRGPEEGRGSGSVSSSGSVGSTATAPLPAVNRNSNSNDHVAPYAPPVSHRATNPSSSSSAAFAAAAAAGVAAATDGISTTAATAPPPAPLPSHHYNFNKRKAPPTIPQDKSGGVSAAQAHMLAMQAAAKLAGTDVNRRAGVGHGHGGRFVKVSKLQAQSDNNPAGGKGKAAGSGAVVPAAAAAAAARFDSLASFCNHDGCVLGAGPSGMCSVHAPMRSIPQSQEVAGIGAGLISGIIAPMPISGDDVSGWYSYYSM